MSNTITQDRDQIVYNAVQCLVCEQVVESTHRHDYKVCKCSNRAMADGGLEYYRWGGADMSKVRHLGVGLCTPYKKLRRFAFRWNNRLNKPVRLYKMSNEWLEAAIEYIIETTDEPDPLWHFILLLQEKQYRIDNELYVKEEQITPEEPKAHPERIYPASQKEREEETIRIPRLR